MYNVGGDGFGLLQRTHGIMLPQPSLETRRVEPLRTGNHHQVPWSLLGRSFIVYKGLKPLKSPTTNSPNEISETLVTNSETPLDDISLNVP